MSKTPMSATTTSSSGVTKKMETSSSCKKVTVVSKALSSTSSRQVTGNRLFQIYLDSFFKLPEDIKNDIIYCQRTMKAHIKVHQMVLDVFQQQPDADPQQKKRILSELETEIYEINAEQHFLFLRVRRIIDEFHKTLQQNGIPIDTLATNNMVSNEIIPHINDNKIDIVPINVLFRNSEERLIEKYFEVQKEQKPCEIIDLDDDGPSSSSNSRILMEKKVDRSRGARREYSPSTANNANSDSLLMNGRSSNPNGQSLLKPMSQRMSVDTVMDMQPKITAAFSLGEIYNQATKNQAMGTTGSYEITEKPVELPVSTNVKMSRMNLRQALKRAQAAVRGPMATQRNLSNPPPLAPIQSLVSLQPQQQQQKQQQQQQKQQQQQQLHHHQQQQQNYQQQKPSHQQAKISATIDSSGFLKKSQTTKARNTRNSAAAATTTLSKTPETTSSSGEGTPDRSPTPPHSSWPDEIEERRTKAEEYGQEMFLRVFHLFTSEVYAHLQQRRSKRRRRCVQNNVRSLYHYGKIEHTIPPTTSIEQSEPKKKRKAFLLSPQVKKALPTKKAKRRSAEKIDEATYECPLVPHSRSVSSSPDDKRDCNECLKSGGVLEQCNDCKFFYHPTCHHEENDCEEVNKLKTEVKVCPTCKKIQEQLLEKELKKNENLEKKARDLELQLAKEQDRHEILQRTGKQYKIQMNTLFKFVNSIKTLPNAIVTRQPTIDNNIITLD
uniref:PHD-type domain-containing protein n=1 Tax=Glossina brevipalpis TaxID=37001 RepID=A0A1A9X399_9MUSC